MPRNRRTSRRAEFNAISCLMEARVIVPSIVDATVVVWSRAVVVVTTIMPIQHAQAECAQALVRDSDDDFAQRLALADVRQRICGLFEGEGPVDVYVDLARQQRSVSSVK